MSENGKAAEKSAEDVVKAAKKFVDDVIEETIATGVDKKPENAEGCPGCGQPMDEGAMVHAREAITAQAAMFVLGKFTPSQVSGIMRVIQDPQYSFGDSREVVFGGVNMDNVDTKNELVAQLYDVVYDRYSKEFNEAHYLAHMSEMVSDVRDPQTRMNYLGSEIAIYVDYIFTTLTLAHPVLGAVMSQKEKHSGPIAREAIGQLNEDEQNFVTICHRLLIYKHRKLIEVRTQVEKAMISGMAKFHAIPLVVPISHKDTEEFAKLVFEVARSENIIPEADLDVIIATTKAKTSGDLLSDLLGSTSMQHIRDLAETVRKHVDKEVSEAVDAAETAKKAAQTSCSSKEQTQSENGNSPDNETS